MLSSFQGDVDDDSTDGDDDDDDVVEEVHPAKNLDNGRDDFGDSEGGKLTIIRQGSLRLANIQSKVK